jgi:hypothetical protein
MQLYAVYFYSAAKQLYMFSGVNCTHHQEYMKLKLQPPVRVSICAVTSLQRGQLATLGRGIQVHRVGQLLI